MPNVMNQDFKAEWLVALRSGDYEQGKDKLQKDGKFCCLGVACHILAKKGMLETDNTNPMDGVWYGFDGQGSRDVLPKKAQQIMGMEEDSGKLGAFYSAAEGKTPSNYLTELNDEGMTFEEIANIIEQEF